MKCFVCGKKNKKSSKFCSQCGQNLLVNSSNTFPAELSNPPQKDNSAQKLNLYIKLGLIFCILFAPIGLILSSVGYSQAKKQKTKANPAIIGITISTIILIATVVLYCVLGAIFSDDLFSFT